MQHKQIENKRNLEYLNRCRSISSCEKGRKTPYFQTITEQNREAGETRKWLTSLLCIQKHQQNTLFKRFLLLPEVRKLLTQIKKRELSRSRYNLLRDEENEEFNCKVFTWQSDEFVEGVKLSKYNRRKASVALHGDFRRSLYEVTINSMVKPYRGGKDP